MTRHDFWVAGLGFLLGVGATIAAAFSVDVEPDPLDCIALVVCEPMDNPPPPVTKLVNT